MPSPKLELFSVRAFLDPLTCASLIALVDDARRPPTIADDLGIPNFRTSETCDLDSADPLVAVRKGTKYELTKWFRERAPG